MEMRGRDFVLDLDSAWVRLTSQMSRAATMQAKKRERKNGLNRVKVSFPIG